MTHRDAKYTKTQSIAPLRHSFVETRCFASPPCTSLRKFTKRKVLRLYVVSVYNTQRIAYALCFVEAQYFASPPYISRGNVQRRKVLRLYVISVYNTQRIAHALCFVEAQYFASPPYISRGKCTKTQSIASVRCFRAQRRNVLRLYVIPL
jgi:hypothetical protein